MSFHGGLIGIIFVSILFANKHNQNPFLYLDIVALMSPIGIFFGRVANFINSELYGIETSVPWAVKFIKVDDLYRHPSQLYEALLEGLILFLILNTLIFTQKYKAGTCSYLFLIYYGVFRIIAELFREPDIQMGYLIGQISMGMVLSSFMIVIGSFAYYRLFLFK